MYNIVKNPEESIYNNIFFSRVGTALHLELDQNLEFNLECECIRLLFARISDFDFFQAAWWLSIRWNPAQFDGIGIGIGINIQSVPLPKSNDDIDIIETLKNLSAHSTSFM